MCKISHKFHLFQHKNFKQNSSICSYENNKFHHSKTITEYIQIMQSVIYSYNISPDLTLLFQSKESQWYTVNRSIKAPECISLWVSHVQPLITKTSSNVLAPPNSFEIEARQKSLWKYKSIGSFSGFYNFKEHQLFEWIQAVHCRSSLINKKFGWTKSQTFGF